MGLFSRKEKRSAEPETTPEVSADLLRALFDNDKLTAEMALEIPAFSAAVDFVANTVAMLPVKLYKEDLESRKTEEVTDDRRLFLLNDEANSLMGAKECRAAQIRDMLLFGSGFVFIEKSGYGEISSLRYVEKKDVSITSNAHPIFKDFNIYVGGNGYPPFNFVILARNSKDGVTGTGAVEQFKTLMSAMFSTMKYEKSVSKTGGNKKGFLQSDHVLTDAAIEKLKQAWRELYANNENNLMVLNNGIKYNPSAASAVEMQMNENKRTNSEQIAQIFGLSPEVTSGKCSTADYMSAVRTAILPVVEKYQEAINRSLLTEEEKRTMYFALDTSELLKGDTLARYQAYEIALRNNFLQLDEVRYAEDKEPLGFEYMRLGLNDVLYDSKTKTVYTPNMNALANLDGSHLTSDEVRCIMELRKKMNWVKGSKGRFAGSVPMGGSMKIKSQKPHKPEKPNKPIKLGKKEQMRVSSAIATNFPSLKADGKLRDFCHGNYKYRFGVVEFGTYKFYGKKKLE